MLPEYFPELGRIYLIKPNAHGVEKGRLLVSQQALLQKNPLFPWMNLQGRQSKYVYVVIIPEKESNRSENS